jgi:hypothetical protein
MKKYLFSVAALALAISFSAFTTVAPILSFDAADLDATTVQDPASYGTVPNPSCPGGSTTPCKIDIQGFANEAAYLSHLSTLADDAARIADVQGRNVGFKN